MPKVIGLYLGISSSSENRSLSLPREEQFHTNLAQGLRQHHVCRCWHDGVAKNVAAHTHQQGISAVCFEDLRPHPLEGKHEVLDIPTVSIAPHTSRKWVHLHVLRLVHVHRTRAQRHTPDDIFLGARPESSPVPPCVVDVGHSLKMTELWTNLLPRFPTSTSVTL